MTQPATTRLLTNPGYAPELLAVAAVEVLGPAARAWVHNVTTRYPAADSGGLARLATQRFVRLATAGGALSGATGLLLPLTGLAAVAWARAGLVLHLAAAYGQDPTDVERAVELLTLTRVHPDEALARAALAVAAAPPDPDAPWHAAVGRLQATSPKAGAGAMLSARLASRWLPGTALLGAAAGSSAGTYRLAARAVAYYRSRAAAARSA